MFLNLSLFSILLGVCGLYCILVTRNLFRILIGLELITKGITLLLIAAGYITGHTATAQALVITLIALEVVVIVVGGGIILSIYWNNKSMDVRNLRHLKG
ncbi:MAG: NADH-quinone oxidoreductase subunit K [Candidatus Saganbacteria bacterium]|nr:NADH-quinone oxidoreductase subunit K [Candidatus Saganbacteria bacterium]